MEAEDRFQRQSGLSTWWLGNFGCGSAPRWTPGIRIAHTTRTSPKFAVVSGTRSPRGFRSDGCSLEDNLSKVCRTSHELNLLLFLQKRRDAEVGRSRESSKLK